MSADGTFVPSSSDLHPTWVSHIEGGSNPAFGTLKRIASSLGVKVSEIVRLAEEIEDGEKPRLVDFMPRINRNGGSITSTERAERPSFRDSTP
jgi:hypothetical protein